MDTARQEFAYDPYQSFVVKASAGSGKTYQLSRRFVFLVASGAPLNKILTLTFTNQAAHEMKERILALAAEILSSPAMQKELDDYLKIAHSQAMQRLQDTELDYKIPPPIGLRHACYSILSHSQSLNITTIDSIFYSWMNRFPRESLKDLFALQWKLPEIADSQKLKALDTAYQKSIEPLLNKVIDECGLNNSIKNHGWAPPMELSKKDWLARAIALQTNEESFWVASKLFGDSENLYKWSVNADDASSIEALFRSIAPELNKIFEGKKVHASVMNACNAKDFEALLATKVISKTLELSGTYVRGKTKETHAEGIATVSRVVQSFVNNKVKNILNTHAKSLKEIFLVLNDKKQRLKESHSIVEFSDLTKAAVNLFADDDLKSVQYFIQLGIEHMLVDEFQDTSFQQWYALSKVAHEIRSGMGIDYGEKPLPSLFIVGDQKQSIYGFRGASPELMDQAGTALSLYDLQYLHLSKTYRNSGLIVRFINHLFTFTKLQAFEPHSATDKNESLSSSIEIVLAPENDDSEDSESRLSPVEIEAYDLAQDIFELVSGKNPVQVLDKASGMPRPIKPEDICILYRSSTRAQLYESSLKRLGISTRRLEDGGFFDRYEILDFENIFKFNYDKCDKGTLLAIFHNPLFELSQEEINALFAEINASSSDAKMLVSVVSSFLSSNAPDALAVFETMQNLTSFLTIRRFVDYLIKDCHIGSRYSARWGFSAGKEVEANLRLCLSKLESEGYLYCHQLRGVLNFFSMQKQLDSLSPQTSGAGCVTLMTIHKSKGMEFPYVAVCELGSNWTKPETLWVKRKNSLEYAYIGRQSDYPKSDPEFDQVLNHINKENLDEMKRLFYVAVTRAKQHLRLSGNGDLDLSFLQTLKGGIVPSPSDITVDDELGLNEYIFQLFLGGCFRAAIQANSQDLHLFGTEKKSGSRGLILRSNAALGDSEQSSDTIPDDAGNYREESEFEPIRNMNLAVGHAQGLSLAKSGIKVVFPSSGKPEVMPRSLFMFRKSEKSKVGLDSSEKFYPLLGKGRGNFSLGEASLLGELVHKEMEVRNLGLGFDLDAYWLDKVNNAAASGALPANSIDVIYSTGLELSANLAGAAMKNGEWIEIVNSCEMKFFEAPVSRLVDMGELQLLKGNIDFLGWSTASKKLYIVDFKSHIGKVFSNQDDFLGYCNQSSYGDQLGSYEKALAPLLKAKFKDYEVEKLIFSLNYQRLVKVNG